MAEKNNNQEIEKVRLPKPEENEMLAIVTKLLGNNMIKAFCADGQERVCRIPGKLLKRVWLRENDLIIVKLWDFQPSKADVVHRFRTEYAKQVLKKKGLLGKLEEFI